MMKSQVFEKTTYVIQTKTDLRALVAVDFEAFLAGQERKEKGNDVKISDKGTSGNWVNNHEGSNERKKQTEGAAMKPATPKTELPPTTQLRKVVFGGSHKREHLAGLCAFLLSGIFLLLFSPSLAIGASATLSN